jgi:protein tyrosine/serine phosphatase
MFRKTLFTLMVTSLVYGCGSNSALNTVQVITPEMVSISSDRQLQINTMNFAQVNDHIYRGGVPKEEDIFNLKKVFNVKTLISFRGMATTFNENAQVAEEKAIADELHLKFVNLPVPFDRPIPEKMVRQFFDIIDNPQNGPVYVHCTHGRDRTGTMVALYRISHDKISGPQALKEMQSFGFKPEDYPIYASQVFNSTPAKLSF